jgi:biopolymer transport protein ExbD
MMFDFLDVLLIVLTIFSVVVFYKCVKSNSKSG